MKPSAGSDTTEDPTGGAAYVVSPPVGRPAPVVIDSPHSGFTFPPDWAPSAPLAALRTTWDAHVDRLFAHAPEHGAMLLAAEFPRAFCDVNRAEDDLDPAVLAASWPSPLRPTSYSQRGMGLIRRLALPDVPMYAAPLSVRDVETRITRFYRPYRAALRAMLDEAREADGFVWHVNCHSMKSVGNAMNVDAGAARPDIVVSDGRGTTADPALTARIAEWFSLRGYRSAVNDPYQGGDLVRSFGAPSMGVHSVQIELNRALYMDEATAEPHEGFEALQEELTAFAAALCSWARDARSGLGVDR
ncbi:MAG: N-formylglutamate amidohydrolase [Gemmatimonadaceae bacterium]